MMTIPRFDQSQSRLLVKVRLAMTNLQEGPLMTGNQFKGV